MIRRLLLDLLAATVAGLCLGLFAVRGCHHWCPAAPAPTSPHGRGPAGQPPLGPGAWRMDWCGSPHDVWMHPGGHWRAVRLECATSLEGEWRLEGRTLIVTERWVRAQYHWEVTFDANLRGQYRGGTVTMRRP